MKKQICLGLLLAALCLGGCSSSYTMKDGFYTAEMSGYSHGWKEYICIMVKGGKIVYAEFNAKNPSGYIKAWDNAYMANMLTDAGTYPNEYTRYYASQLVEKQDSSKIDALSGASHSGGNFIRLSEAVINQAIQGNSSAAVVEIAAEETDK